MMRKEFSCDFYIGDHIKTPIKTFKYNQLDGFKGILKNRFFHKFYWQSGSVGLVNKEYQYYILDGEPFCLSSWIILLIAKFKGKTTIAWTHGWYGRESLTKRVIKKLFYSLHSKLMIYDEYAISLMEKEGICNDKMFCIANSLDSDKEKEIRQGLKDTDIYKKHFGNNYPTIIYCGRIQKWKKLNLLIDSIKMLKDENVLVNVVFVGKDVENINIYEYAISKGIKEQAWMYGPCYNDEILGELFYNANVCVSPGNVGLTAIHALTFGCPVITHGNLPYQGPEFEAIKPGLTGDFFKEDDINDLKEKIKKWISLSKLKREEVRTSAYEEIDRKWNISYQLNIIKKVIYG